MPSFNRTKHEKCSCTYCNTSRAQCRTRGFIPALSKFRSTSDLMPVVLIEKQTPQIAIVTLNRPKRRNPLTIELLNELTSAIKVSSVEPHDPLPIRRAP